MKESSFGVFVSVVGLKLFCLAGIMSVFYFLNTFVKSGNIVSREKRQCQF